MHFSKKFKKAWARSNQRMHDMLLARPKTRYLQRWPDPALERSLPAPVPLAALRAKPTARILTLAMPKSTPPMLPPKEPGVVDPAVLQYQPTQRILELARPVLKSRPLSRTKSARGKKRAYSRERVKLLATKKTSFKPPVIAKKPAKPLSALMPRIKLLCELPLRYQSPELPPVPVPTKLKLEEKGYQVSERIKQLAQPREFAEFKLDEDFDPYTINPAALTYVATENVKKLAEPRRKEEKRTKKG